MACPGAWPGDTWPCGCCPPAVGVAPPAPAGAVPRAGGSDSRSQKQFPLRFWCFKASMTLNRSSSLAYSSTSPTHMLKPFDKFQNETCIPSRNRAHISSWEGLVSSGVCLTQLILDKQFLIEEHFQKYRIFHFRCIRKTSEWGLNFLLVFTREVITVCKVLLGEEGLKPTPYALPLN